MASNKTAGSNMESKEISPDFLDWLVESRTKNQRALAKLYRMIKSSTACWENNILGYEAKTLISVGFSLWRAAFLAGKTGKGKDTDKASILFLAEVLETNAIGFPQDKKANDFTFNYYVANVRFRLAEYNIDNIDFKVNKKLLEKGGAAEEPKARWEEYQAAFDDAIVHFEQRLSTASFNQAPVDHLKHN